MTVSCDNHKKSEQNILLAKYRVSECPCTSGMLLWWQAIFFCKQTTARS